MGAGASLELQEEARKPADCSDLQGCDLQVYKAELGSLREKLMKFVDDKTQWPPDLSDICTGDPDEDLEACHRELCYLRNALQLQTKSSSSSRRNRHYDMRRASVDSDACSESNGGELEISESKRRK